MNLIMDLNKINPHNLTPIIFPFSFFPFFPFSFIILLPILWTAGRPDFATRFPRGSCPWESFCRSPSAGSRGGTRTLSPGICRNTRSPEGSEAFNYYSNSN